MFVRFLVLLIVACGPAGAAPRGMQTHEPGGRPAAAGAGVYQLQGDNDGLEEARGAALSILDRSIQQARDEEPALHLRMRELLADARLRKIGRGQRSPCGRSGGTTEAFVVPTVNSDIYLCPHFDLEP